MEDNQVVETTNDEQPVMNEAPVVNEAPIKEPEPHSDFRDKLSAAIAKTAGRKEPIKSETVEETQESTPADNTPEEKETNALDDDFKLIPKEWNQVEKETFEQALENPELKDAAKVFMDRYDGLRKGFHSKSRELAEIKKDSNLDDFLDPTTKGQLEAKGYTPKEYFKRLVDVEKQLIQNPVETLKRLAQGYNVDLSALVEKPTSSSDEYFDYDDKIKEMEQRLNKFTEQTEAQKRAQSAAQEQSVAKQISDFQNALDDTGEPKYPLFNDVRDEMGVFLNNGKAKTLEEAYNMSPTVKEQLLEAKLKDKEERNIEDERRRVAKAKRAAGGYSTGNKAPNDAKRLPMERELARRLKAASGR